MSVKPFFRNWMVAVAEATEVAGASDLEAATAGQMTKAWGMVRKAAGISLPELTERVAEEARIPVADLQDADPHATILVPARLARERNVLAIHCTDRDLTVATANPLSQDTKRTIASLASRQVAFEIAPPGDIASAVEEAYGPATDDESESAFDEQPEVAQPDGPHILVIDDEVGQRALFRSILENAGYRVTVASDGPEAIGIMDEDPSLDMITLDYWMDKMNGLRVLQQIRSKPTLARVPVIMVTGANDRRIEMSLFEAGADDFIVKPVDAPLFILRIQAVLRRRRFD